MSFGQLWAASRVSGGGQQGAETEGGETWWFLKMGDLQNGSKP
jgi:hypothetical protein